MARKIRSNITTTIDRRTALQGIAAIGVTFAVGGTGGNAHAACEALNFYNWDTYIGPNTLSGFTKETDIEVQYDLYADNDELFAKLKNGNPGYDLIVPSNDFVERMIVADMLAPLDHSKISNIKNIEPEFMDVGFDPGRKFSLPYMWGTIGIGYRKTAAPDGIDSWNDILASDKYAGRISVLGEATSMMQTALIALGKDLNDWSDENIAAAEKMLIDQKKNITAFAPDNGQDLLLAGEVDFAIEYNGDILQIMEEDDDIGYVVPKEGAIRWEDCLAIPKGGPCPENAHKMIDFILGAKEGAEIAAEINYATPNAEAKKLMEADYLENPAVFPSPEVMKNLKVAVFPGQENVRKIDEAWTRIKAAG